MIIKRLYALFLILMLSACAHPINIAPTKTLQHTQAKASQKSVAYVWNDDMRSKSVTTAGGGGDSVSYYPYRDLEKSVRDALSAVYGNVSVIKSADDKDALVKSGVALVFSPVITTKSSSDSVLTWPPTHFDIHLDCPVADVDGKSVAVLTVDAAGAAEFSEFKSDVGLAGRRAADILAEQLKAKIESNPQLK